MHPWPSLYSRARLTLARAKGKSPETTGYLRACAACARRSLLPLVHSSQSLPLDLSLPKPCHRVTRRKKKKKKADERVQVVNTPDTGPFKPHSPP